MQDVRYRVLSEVRKYRMFGSEDSVLIGVSGGKDSYVLLDVMLSFHSPSKLGAVTVVEGIPNYDRREHVGWVKALSKEYGFDHFIVSFKDYVGHGLGELVELSRAVGLSISPCTYCGMLRRRIMNDLARELGFGKVAIAHTLDDEVQTALLNILRGDLLRLVQTHPAGPSLSSLFVKRIKPLRKIYEVEVAIYAYLKGFNFQEKECPYITSYPTLRAWLRKKLYALERREPGTMLRFLELIDALVKELIPEYQELPELPRCVRCGQPTAYGRNICKLCELLEKIGVDTVPSLGRVKRT